MVVDPKIGTKKGTNENEKTDEEYDLGLMVNMRVDGDKVLQKDMLVMIMIQVKTKIAIVNCQFWKLLKLLD